MHWFGGSMVEAVNLSKQKNKIFVVFIEGDNDLSAELAATIESQAVVKKLSNQDNFLAVKLESGSENYTHFAKIYQFVPVPSLFFIGRNGTPLEVVCAGMAPQTLAERIDRILGEHYKEKRIQPSTSGQNIKEQTNNLLQAESSRPDAPPPPQPEPSAQADTSQPQKPETRDEPAKAVQPDNSEPPAKVAKTEHREVTSSGREYDVVCDGDVCVRRPRSPAQPGPSQPAGAAPTATATVQETTSSASIEEKLDHAKELIEARRREKAEKEKELEKEKERERRATGQGVAELKRWQAEQEMKQLQEERKREKLENDLARQRILAQIAQDRAERRARDTTGSPTPAPAPVPASHAATSGDAAGEAAAGGARVQFKLPDGSAHTAQFDAHAPLSQVQRYVADNLQLSASSFALWTAFPRRELSEPAATLRELQLAPSAALLVLPRRASAPAPPARAAPLAGIIALITQLFTTMVLDPSYAVYNWVRNRLFPSAPRAPTPGAAPTAAPTRGPTPPNPTGGLRRRGNIHRLAGDTASDDDNNTWNGNSTQQM